MASDGTTGVTSSVVNSIMASATLSDQYSIVMAAKAQDAAKQQGQNAVALIQAASLLDVRA